MTKEQATTANETVLEDKLVPTKYLARLRKQADAIGDAALALELESAVSQLNKFSATDIHFANKVIINNTESEYHVGYPRDLNGQKMGSEILGGAKNLKALDKILDEAREFVTRVAPVEKRFNAVVEKLREARNRLGLGEEGKPLSTEPKAPVHLAQEFHATPIKSYAAPSSAIESTRLVSAVSDAANDAAPSAVTNPLKDYYSALTDIYRQDIGVEDGWKKVEALYQNIRSQNFSKSSGNEHLKINDINAKLQSVLVGMFEHDTLTPEKGLPILSNVLEELYDDVRAIDARERFFSSLEERTPSTGPLGSTALTATWLEALPSTIVPKHTRGYGYYGGHETPEAYEKAKQARVDLPKKLALGTIAAGLIAVPAAYLMRPQVAPYNPNDRYVPEMPTIQPRNAERLQDAYDPMRNSPPSAPYTPPPREAYENIPLPPAHEAREDPSTQLVDTPYGPMSRDIWEMTQDADRRFGRAGDVLPDESGRPAEHSTRNQTLDAPSGATLPDADDTLDTDQALPAATTNEPEGTPATDPAPHEISVRPTKDGGYRARFSMKGENFTEKALTPDSTTVTFRS